MSESPESLLVNELRALAGPSASEKSRFSVPCGGHDIAVEYNGGSSSSLTLVANYDRVARRDHPAVHAQAGYRRGKGPLRAHRPMNIELRPENTMDVGAKRRGLSVEWQSGDSAFDQSVYVSSPLQDADVLSAVLGEEVRSGVIELLALGFRRVLIDEDGRISASLTEFAVPAAAAKQGRGPAAALAFSKVLSNIPIVEHAPGAHLALPLSGWTRTLKVIGILGWATNVGFVGGLVVGLRALFGASEELPTTLQLTLSIAFAIVFGVLGARTYCRILEQRLRGRSDAHTQLLGAQFSAFGGFSVLSLVLLLAFGMALASR